MAYSANLTAFAQSVYLAIKNRYLDDVDGADGQTYISEVVDWVNQYLDEFETIVDSFGQPVQWKFMRTPGLTLGTAATGETQLDIPDGILSLVAAPRRPVTITVSGKVVSKWAVVNPNQFDGAVTDRQVTLIGDSLYFNQPLVAAENGGTIAGDVTRSLTRISADGTNDGVISVVKPRQLLVLGVAKNSSLPDIVQGGLSPSFVQKYNDLLTSAILFNNASATSDSIDREDFSFVGGVGF